MMKQKTTPVAELAELPRTISPDGPRSLSYGAYPKPSDVAQRGVQLLPATLPLADLVRAQPHRSRRYSTVVTADLAPAQLLQMARVVASSFVRNEPMARHLRPPRHPPAGLMEARHSDPFGSGVPFGLWSMETLLYWFIRLYLLTDPTSPQNAIQVNEEALPQSLATVDGRGQVIGGAFNETMPSLDVAPEFPRDDPFLAAVFAFLEPI